MPRRAGSAGEAVEPHAGTMTIILSKIVIKRLIE